MLQQLTLIARHKGTFTAQEDTVKTLTVQQKAASEAYMLSGCGIDGTARGNDFALVMEAALALAVSIPKNGDLSRCLLALLSKALLLEESKMEEDGRLVGSSNDEESTFGSDKGSARVD